MRISENETYLRLPLVGRGGRIGLLGGSFDPAHAGHVAITHEALKRFHLDAVWWLVSPHNPLKGHAPQGLARRIAHARAMMDHPRVKIIAPEAALQSRYSVDTLRWIMGRRPRARFVWIMGADNLAGFHQWHQWQRIMAMVPVAVLARPGLGPSALHSPCARTYRPHRVPPRALPHPQGPPAWAFAHIPLRAEASTTLRQSGVWG